MESKDAAAQLSDLHRLRAATQAESYRTPPGAWPVMVAAMVAYLGSFTFVRSDTARIWEAAGWTAFVAAWVVWLRFRRAAVPNSQRPRITARAVVEWIVLFAVCNLIVIVFSRVSWALVGVLIAIVATFAGSRAARARRA